MITDLFNAMPVEVLGPVATAAVSALTGAALTWLHMRSRVAEAERLAAEYEAPSGPGLWLAERRATAVDPRPRSLDGDWRRRLGSAGRRAARTVAELRATRNSQTDDRRGGHDDQPPAGTSGGAGGGTTHAVPAPRPAGEQMLADLVGDVVHVRTRLAAIAAAVLPARRPAAAGRHRFTAAHARGGAA